MTHQFEIEEAVEYGIEAAIILQNIRFWISKNKANQKHFYNGRYWTYNSYKAFQELFPYLSIEIIKRSILKLEKAGVLISGNFNDTGSDRTKWYSVAQSPVFQCANSHDHSAKLHDQCANSHVPLCEFAHSLYTDNKHTDINTDIKEKNKEKSFEEIFEEVEVLGETETPTQTELSLKKEKNSAKKEKKTEVEKSFEEVYNQFYKEILKTDADYVFGKWEKIALNEIIQKCKKLTPQGQSEIDVWRVIVSMDSWKTIDKFWQDKFGIKQINNNFDSIFYQMTHYRERNKTKSQIITDRIVDATMENLKKIENGTFNDSPFKDIFGY